MSPPGALLQLLQLERHCVGFANMSSQLVGVLLGRLRAVLSISWILPGQPLEMISWPTLNGISRSPCKPSGSMLCMPAAAARRRHRVRLCHCWEARQSC